MKKHILRKVASGRRVQNFAMTILTGFLTSIALAQPTFQVGTATGTTSNAPVNTYYGYSYSQQIYYASELQGLGAVAGTITKIRFNVVTQSSSVSNSDLWKVHIGHTTKTAFASNSDWEVAANLTQCFNGTVSFPGNGNWMEIELTTPFVWNGVDNLVVAIEEDKSGYNSTTNWQQSWVAELRTIYYRNDWTNPDPASPPSALGRQNQRPNIQFVIPPVCAGTPTHGTAISTPASVCVNGNATLSTDVSYFELGNTYQWQMNDGTGWSDINGANEATHSLSNMTETMDYRLIITCQNSMESDTSDAVNVVVNPLPTVTLNTSYIANCLGDPAQLIASGADTYSWAPATDLDVTTGSTVLASSTTSRTYTVTGTSIDGCINTAQVIVTPVDEMRGTTLYTPIENCTFGSPVTVEVNNLSPDITSGGTWEYRWLAEDSITVVQDWNSSNSYTFIPAQDGVYGNFYQIRSTSCPSDYVDSIYAQISIGFGANVDLIHYDCNTMGGTISLSDIYGQTAMDTIFMDDLSAANSNLTLTGNAAFTNGRVELTPSATSKSGSLTIMPSNFNAGVNNAVTFRFDLTADLPINNWGTGGGDGMAFSFGNDAVIGGVGPYQNGKGSKLRLVFDAANNSNGNVSGIYLTYGFNANDMAPASSGVLAYSDNTALWKTQTDVPVVLEISTSGMATVTVGGVVIFNNIQMPAAYMQENVNSWKHLFTALTGGDALRHAVKNYVVEGAGMKYGITEGGSAVAPSTWQDETQFTSLLPGEYDIWISKDEDAICMKNIGTYEILNLNPVVALGNDTTICNGETLTLDAGNPGSVYTWSNTNNYTQTLDVTESGNYVVYVTNADGCTGIGSIDVQVSDAPTANGIYVEGSTLEYTLTVIGANNADSYDWDFGDGNTVIDGPASISHTYALNGDYTVTATLTNSCGSTDVQELMNNVGIAKINSDSFKIYPNPSTGFFTVETSDSEEMNYVIYTLDGALIQDGNFVNSIKFNTTDWNKGVYFVHVSNSDNSTVQKVVVQ